jgi:hypothetical protein
LASDLTIAAGYNAMLMGDIDTSGHNITVNGTGTLRIL